MSDFIHNKLNNNMSERLSKLVEYLDDGNYEMAIEAYKNEQPAELDHQYRLELARAFYVN